MGDTDATVAGDGSLGPVVGRVLGTDDATPLAFWVAVMPGRFLQLDDVVALHRDLPDGQRISISGIVTQIRARHEGARFDSDVFLVADGVLPAEVSEAAQILATRFDPEVFVPPRPMDTVRKARGAERERALLIDTMERRLPAGMSRDGEPMYVDLDFLDGARGAHVNISGVSGVATKTTYATFLLHSLFRSGQLGAAAANTKAIIFNVKGEDLLFLDKANRRVASPRTADPAAARFAEEQRERYAALGLPAEPFSSVQFWAPPRRGSAAADPDVASRATGVTSFFWTLHEFCREGFLAFLFADLEDERQQYTIVVQNVMAQLARAQPNDDGGVTINVGGDSLSAYTFEELVDGITERLQGEDDRTVHRWSGRAIGQGTINAFIRRLHSAVRHIGHLIRGDVAEPERHRIDWQEQVTVIDLHNLNERAQRFVVGIVLRRAFDQKERSGNPDPRWYVVLDELNKYAPREGRSPIKDLILDIAERGRSLGIILIGAQQSASEVEQRVVSNAAIRVAGRLDAGEASRADYGWLPAAQRQRATIVKPGTMMLSQPAIPIPIVIEFPFPAWATRKTEVVEPSHGGDGDGHDNSDGRGSRRTGSGAGVSDPFAGLTEEDDS